MELFKRQIQEDSLIERRERQGKQASPYEMQMKIRRELKEQKELVEQLYRENCQLREELDKATRQLETAAFVHSMDELIDTMREQGKKQEPSGTNPFASLFKMANASSDSGGQQFRDLDKDTVIKDDDAR